MSSKTILAKHAFYVMYFKRIFSLDTKYLLVATLPITKGSFSFEHELVMCRNVLVIKEGGRHLDITLIILYIYNIRLMKFVAPYFEFTWMYRS